MLKWMVTAARGQAGDEVSLAEAGDQEPGIFTISRDNPLYSVMEEEGDVVTEIVEYRTLESSHSSGYSSADLNTLSLARSKQDARCVICELGMRILRNIVWERCRESRCYLIF